MATFWNASFISLPLRTVGKLDFAGLCKILTISDKACTIAPVSVNTGMGVVLGMSWSVSVSTSE